MDWWATDEVNKMIMKHLRVNSMEEVYKKLHIDKPFGVYPEYKGPKIPEGYDMFGCKYKKMQKEKIVFHGAVDNQHTLPFGTVKEVREEVIYNIKVLGKGGGYILAPCHNIQPLTPVENIITLMKQDMKTAGIKMESPILTCVVRMRVTKGGIKL